MFHLSTVSDDTVISVISSLDTNKAAGVDGILPDLLRPIPLQLVGLLFVLLTIALHLVFFLICGNMQL